MSSNLQPRHSDLQPGHDQPDEPGAPRDVLAALITTATATWQATLRLTIVCTALALPATVILILFLLIR